MTNLTRISILTRKIIRYSIYTIVGIILLRAAILTSIKIYRYFFPAPPPAPTVEFGRLPPLPFPDKERPEGLTFNLETATGEFPAFNDQAKVYLMTRLSSRLLSLDAAKAKAADLDFSPEGVDITETVYRFTHEKAPAELRINIVTGVFSISYNLELDPSPLDSLPPTAEVATKRASSFMEQADIFPEDLTGPVIPEFVKIRNKKIVGAISQSDADFTKIHFFRKDYDELPSLTPTPGQANVWFIISGDPQKEKQIIAAEFHHFPVDESKLSTYPIKTAQAAFEELKNGGGYIASLGTNQYKNITVRRIYLAYYDAGQAIDFFQPIFVLEGDGGFVAYVPAVTSTYYGE